MDHPRGDWLKSGGTVYVLWDVQRCGYVSFVVGRMMMLCVMGYMSSVACHNDVDGWHMARETWHMIMTHDKWHIPHPIWRTPNDLCPMHDVTRPNTCDMVMSCVIRKHDYDIRQMTYTAWRVTCDKGMRAYTWHVITTYDTGLMSHDVWHATKDLWRMTYKIIMACVIRDVWSVSCDVCHVIIWHHHITRSSCRVSSVMCDVWLWDVWHHIFWDTIMRYATCNEDAICVIYVIWCCDDCVICHLSCAMCHMMVIMIMIYEICVIWCL